MSEEFAPAEPFGLPRVLIVDDDVALSGGVRRAIESQGYIVQTADRGPAALEAVDVFKPDLIVLDVMMPDMDGWEVLARLRASVATERIPVIMLTAADSEAAKVKGFTLGADDYLTKPFTLTELRLRIAAVLKRARPEPAAAEHALPVVVGGGSQTEFIRCSDVYYVEGVRNFSYIHTSSSRFLSRMTLGSIEQQSIPRFRRVHRSFIVNMDHVRGCGWVSKSAYRLRLADLEGTELPVSRGLVSEVQRLLGLRD